MFLFHIFIFPAQNSFEIKLQTGLSHWDRSPFVCPAEIKINKRAHVYLSDSVNFTALSALACGCWRREKKLLWWSLPVMWVMWVNFLEKQSKSQVEKEREVIIVWNVLFQLKGSSDSLVTVWVMGADRLAQEVSRSLCLSFSRSVSVLYPWEFCHWAAAVVSTHTNDEKPL